MQNVLHQTKEILNPQSNFYLKSDSQQNGKTDFSKRKSSELSFSGSVHGTGFLYDH